MKPKKWVTDIRHKTEVHYAAPDAGTVELKVVRVAHEHWGPRYRARRTIDNGYLIAYVAGGAGYFIGSRGRIALRQGMIYTRAPGPPNEYGCDPGDPLEVFITIAEGRKAAKLFGRCVPRPNHAFAIAHPHEIARVMQAMFDQAVSQSPMSSSICDHYFAILLMTLRQCMPGRGEPNSRARQTYLSARQYLSDGFRSARSIQDAAAHCGVSHEHLCRLFKTFGDDTPHAYLQRLKMNHAAHLLNTTPRTVKEIARALGYPDPFSFSKSFKKWHGRSPRQYRAETS